MHRQNPVAPPESGVHPQNPVCTYSVTMAILREMGIDHKYRFSGNGKLVPKQPAADGTKFGPYSAAAIPTLPVPEIKALSLIKLHTSGGRRNM